MHVVLSPPVDCLVANSCTALLAWHTGDFIVAECPRSLAPRRVRQIFNLIVRPALSAARWFAPARLVFEHIAPHRGRGKAAEAAALGKPPTPPGPPLPKFGFPGRRPGKPNFGKGEWFILCF